MSRLEGQLVLFDFVTELLGGNYAELVRELKGAALGARADGHSHFFAVLESRGARVRLAHSDLAEYDLRILGYEARLGQQRPQFRFTYFQYLAALYSEIYLAWLASDARGLLREVRAFHARRGFVLPRYEASDLTKLAFWMATGSGKTLIAHVNLLQWQHYRPFDADNVILVTPSETLSKQHMEELALSGISAARADKAGGWADVQVIEIHKLYIDGAGTEKRRSGVSMPVSAFEGRNLVLVDEGHKGSTTAADANDERRWRAIREALAGPRGFTVEYSATFAQITEGNDDLLREYSKAILVDYGYRRFWEDGYGKDYQVVNLRDEGAYDVDELLLAGLLTLYEQRRYFDEHPAEVSEYNIAAPLMVFVGATVTGAIDSEVLAVVRFLDRVLGEPIWAEDIVRGLLEGTHGLPEDLFAHQFLYLRELGTGPSHICADLRERLFHGHGRLRLHHIRRSEGEIGLRVADADRERYCGVVNVGDAARFFRMAVEAGLMEGDDDHFEASLFESIEDEDSPVSFLVGSKKFIEGWSSWRVSVMGLLRVGRTAGPQVVQLFGRGVRLRGRGNQLRRSTALPGPHPEGIRLLEMLHIFGVRADYMQVFNEAIRREGMPPPVARALPIVTAPDIAALELLVPEPGGYQFSSEVVVFDPSRLDREIVVDVFPEFLVAQGIAPLAAVGDASPPDPVPLPMSHVDSERAFLHALELKRHRGWSNIYITRTSIDQFLSASVLLHAPAQILLGDSERDRSVLNTAAMDAVTRGLERFAYTEQCRREQAHLEMSVITAEHSNFPRPWARTGDDTPAYLLDVPEDLLEAVDVTVARITTGELPQDDDLAEPLPRLFMAEHLYGPMLVAEAQEAGAGPRAFGVLQGVRSTPAGLVGSEVAFIQDLKETWSRLSHTRDWQGFEIHLLRNLPRRGVGFFVAAGFYPDFLLWLKNGESQALVFVEPHGMVIWDPTKVDLLQHIRDLALGIPLLAFIVTPTEPLSVGAIGGAGHHREQWFRERHILFQSDAGYVESILLEARAALTGASVLDRSASVPIHSEVPEAAQFETMLPLYSLAEAVGRFGDGAEVPPRGWVAVPDRVLSPDMFVVAAEGDALEPRLRAGDLCVLRRLRVGRPGQKIALVQWQGTPAPETGRPFAMRTYASERRLVEGGQLTGGRITLGALNPAYEPLVLDVEFSDDVQVLAEHVASLGAPDLP